VIGPIDLIFAFFLDLAIGDPPWLPHPVRIMGKGIEKMEIFLRRHFKQNEERLAGILLAIITALVVLAVTFLIYKVIIWFSSNILMIIGIIVLVYLISTTIALHELINSARLVIEAVKDRSIKVARQRLSRIVGRDTANLSDEGILKATIETLAENLSDGVIAPVFYLVVGGLPLAMAYKAINTLDSMVGYKNEKYRHFGWAAAKLDDIANYIPARITGILIVISSALISRSLSTVRCSLKTMLRDGRKHPSPNSGVPEAAMAGALGVRLGGPLTYEGIKVEKPYIGEDTTEDYLTAFGYAVNIIKVTSISGVGIAAIILSLRPLT
jgi:adenosylcobinamide-phosphate synthase